MTTATLLASIRKGHQDHAGNPAVNCDACRLLELVDRQRTAMERVMEMASKSQLDPAGVNRVLQEVMGR